MDWKSLAKTAGNLGLKVLGGALGGPAGSAIGSQVATALGLSSEATPDQVAEALATASPEALVQLKQLEVDIEKANIEAGIKHHEMDALIVSGVNETMRVEAQQGHPWSGAWRPFWGFVSAIAFAFAVVGIIALAAYGISTKNHDLLSTVPDLVGQLTFLFSVPGAILGVASWHRGKMQRIESGEQTTGLISALVGLKKK